MFKPLVSIVIPVYNRENMIEESINSAISQTYDNMEVIVTDNCSSDGTWEKILELSRNEPRLKIFKNPENFGPVENWRIALQKCSGEYVKILWSDDLIRNDFVECCLKHFDKNVAFVFSRYRLFEDRKELKLNLRMIVKNFARNVINRKKLKSENYINCMIDEGRKNYPVSPGCALFRSNDLKAWLSLRLNQSEDLDFEGTGAGYDLLMFLMTAFRYKYVIYLQKDFSYFRKHSGSITISRSDMVKKCYKESISYFKECYLEKK